MPGKCVPYWLAWPGGSGNRKLLKVCFKRNILCSLLFFLCQPPLLPHHSPLLEVELICSRKWSGKQGSSAPTLRLSLGSQHKTDLGDSCDINSSQRLPPWVQGVLKTPAGKDSCKAILVCPQSVVATVVIFNLWE